MSAKTAAYQLIAEKILVEHGARGVSIIVLGEGPKDPVTGFAHMIAPRTPEEYDVLRQALVDVMSKLAFLLDSHVDPDRVTTTTLAALIERHGPPKPKKK